MVDAERRAEELHGALRAFAEEMEEGDYAPAFVVVGVEEGEQFICEEIFNFEDGDLICAVDKTEKVFIGRGFALGHSILISIEDSSRPIPRKEILFLGKPRKAR